MSILFLTKEESPDDGLWLEHLLEVLSSSICAVGADPLLRKIKYPKRVSLFNLGKGFNPLMAPLCWLPLPFLKPAGCSGIQRLKKEIAHPDTGLVFIPFLDLAVKYEEILLESEKPVFIYCTGRDVMWQSRYHYLPLCERYAPDYPEKVKRLARKATMIACSRFVRMQLMHRGIEKEKIVLCQGGIGVPEMCPERTGRKGPLQILYLDRLVDYKGPDQIIRIFDLACDKGLDAELILAGDGPMRVECERLRMKVNSRDRIHMPGLVTGNEAEDLFWKADLYTSHHRLGIVSQEEDGMGSGILRAMARGLPVISTNSGAVPEIVAHGRSGILVDPGDINGHAEALVRLYRDEELRLLMGKMSWKRVQENFNGRQKDAELRQVLGLSS